MDGLDARRGRPRRRTRSTTRIRPTTPQNAAPGARPADRGSGYRTPAGTRPGPSGCPGTGRCRRSRGALGVGRTPAPAGSAEPRARAPTRGSENTSAITKYLMLRRNARAMSGKSSLELLRVEERLLDLRPVRRRRDRPHDQGEDDDGADEGDRHAPCALGTERAEDAWTSRRPSAQPRVTGLVLLQLRGPALAIPIGAAATS